MKIVTGKPPLFDEIDAAFHIGDRPVLFAWGDTIYLPNGGNVTPALLEHEKVHGARQGSDIEGWWRDYIDDPAFRLDEEIPAHIAEYRWHCRQPGADKPVPGFRSRKIFYEAAIAGRLAGNLYGNLITLTAARNLLAAA